MSGETWSQYNAQSGSSSQAPTITTVVSTGIYDSGSNSNGNWIRFTDGTMICWYSDPNITTTSTLILAPFYTNQTPVYTYPIPFVSIPEISTSCKINTSVVFPGSANPGLTTVNVHLCGFSGAAGYISYQAIGKWK